MAGLTDHELIAALTGKTIQGVCFVGRDRLICLVFTDGSTLTLDGTHPDYKHK